MTISSTSVAGVGPFYRLESPTQTSRDAIRQASSLEIWGRPARGSNIPAVKAYRGPLPASVRGIEFDTQIAPQRGSGSPFEAKWYYPHTPGVGVKHASNDIFAVIVAGRVDNRQP